MRSKAVIQNTDETRFKMPSKQISWNSFVSWMKNASNDALTLFCHYQAVGSLQLIVQAHPLAAWERLICGVWTYI